jgi:transcription factor C subunit 6
VSDRFTLKQQEESAPIDPLYLSTATWTPNVGVHKVTWNSMNGLRHAGWLASGMACGLARIEWVDRNAL